jgi:hypothetical protein
MEEYIKWLENKIEVCLEDKDLQREHWAFCQALSKYRELALRQTPVSDSNLKSLIEQYFEENLIGKFSDNDGEFVKDIIRDFVKNYYH